ncbi:MAG: hypothetical protein AAFW46_17860 [Pseudomonadota bacterium]
MIRTLTLSGVVALTALVAGAAAARSDAFSADAAHNDAMMLGVGGLVAFGLGAATWFAWRRGQDQAPRRVTVRIDETRKPRR